jgi:hypothetical protein
MMGPTTSSLQPLICKASKELEALETTGSTWREDPGDIDGVIYNIYIYILYTVYIILYNYIL